MAVRAARAASLALLSLIFCASSCCNCETLSSHTTVSTLSSSLQCMLTKRSIHTIYVTCVSHHFKKVHTIHETVFNLYTIHQNISTVKVPQYCTATDKPSWLAPLSWQQPQGPLLSTGSWPPSGSGPSPSPSSSCGSSCRWTPAPSAGPSPPTTPHTAPRPERTNNFPSSQRQNTVSK